MNSALSSPLQKIEGYPFSGAFFLYEFSKYFETLIQVILVI